jgi:molybdopterin-guanine dinucleotide biosynthesis protein A
MRKGAIILCGGKSSRMGRDKATLPFGPELMLKRVVRLLGEAVGVEQIVVVGAPTQAIPSLPDGVAIVRDAAEFRGPLQGLANGLHAAGSRFDAVYVSGCDVPLILPAFVDGIFELLADFDAAVPFDGEHYHPLAAVYRPRVLPQIERLLNASRHRAVDLFDEVLTLKIPVEQLRVVDPQLGSLANLNHPDDYHAALSAAGFQG